MATIRENRRERYLTFDPERRSRFSNHWEIALVILIICAGIVITTIAAIKARGKMLFCTFECFPHACIPSVTSLLISMLAVKPLPDQQKGDRFCDMGIETWK
jgi:hypothetical protein